MSWISLIVKDLALGVGPHVMWWLLEGIEPSFDACLSPGGGFRRAAEEKNGRKNDHLEPSLLLALRYPLLSPCLLQPIIPDSYLTPYPPPTQAALDWASDGTDPFHPYQGGPAGRRTLRDLDLGMSSCGRVGPFLAG